MYQLKQISSYVYFLAGEIVNLISVDSQKIEDACLMINLMWSCPLQVGLAIYFLYQTIGVSVFVGKTIFLFTGKSFSEALLFAEHRENKF